MSTLLWIIGATFFVSLISFIGVSILSLKKNFLKRIMSIMVSFAAGALVGVAVFDLIPETIETDKIHGPLFIMVGIVAFFIMEKIIGWHSPHHEEDVDPQGHKTHHHDHAKPFVWINLITDGVHNFTDGVAIAVAFLVNFPLGIATTVAIIFHEIPQEIGDFALLIHGGLTTKKALFYNFLSALTAIAGGLIAFYLSSSVQSLIPVLLGIATGGLLYLPLTDLLPETHKENNIRKGLVQLVCFVIGIAIIYSVVNLIV